VRGGENSTKVPILGEIPVLGTLFKSDADVEAQVNVVIYLTPYIVRKSGDLKRLRTALVELENIQTRYNSMVRRGLEGESEYVEKSTVNASHASNRIKRKQPRASVHNLDILEEEE
jgi:general secretion pathway protein D